MTQQELDQRCADESRELSREFPDSEKSGNPVRDLLLQMKADYGEMTLTPWVAKYFDQACDAVGIPV